MDEGQNNWLAAAVAQLAPGERAALAQPKPNEGVVAHLIRIVRTSGRFKARNAALVALFPAARDRLPGVVEVAADGLRDPSKVVRYTACRALALALDPFTLPALRRAVTDGIEIPWDGAECAIRAIEARDRRAFFDELERTRWILQDEDHDAEYKFLKIVGSAAYGTERR